MIRRVRPLAGLLVVFQLCGWTIGVTGAGASEFGVQPLRVTLSPDRANASVQVNNLGGETVQVHVKVARWTQRNLENVHEDASEIVVNPPLFRLDSLKSQLVRLGAIGLKPAGQERAYRLFLQEVPSPANAGDGLRTLLRISLPIFIPGEGAAKPSLSARLAVDGDRTLVELTNEGNVHVQVTKLDLLGASGTVIAAERGSLYVLPAMTMRWPLSGPKASFSTADSLRLETDQGSLSARLAGSTTK